MNWTQPVCDDCWDGLNPEKPSPRAGQGPHETCCYCGQPTRSGIYIRVDPRLVAFAKEES